MSVVCAGVQSGLAFDDDTLTFAIIVTIPERIRNEHLCQIKRGEF